MNEDRPRSGIPPAKILPPDACAILQKAVNAPPNQRHFAIDAAIDEVKLKYPQFFKSEKE